jgi:hypothetical protein
METAPNWTVSRLGGALVATCYYRDSLQKVPAELLEFESGKGSDGFRNGKRVFRTLSSYTRVIIPLDPTRIVRNMPGIDGFAYRLKKTTLIFGYAMRTQSPDFPIQKKEEIQALLID